jgi:pyrroline-5-carboxylate reductase
MARALGRAWVQQDVVRAADIVAVDCLETACEQFRAVVGAQAETDYRWLKDVDVIVLAVKPQNVGDAASQLGAIREDQLLISIVAGLEISELRGRFRARRIIRVMPNTPCLVGRGASAYALSDHVAPGDSGLAERLLTAAGTAVCLPESMLDAVTGLSGSGPAFVFQFIEAMSDGGVLMGLSRAVATQLSAQTVLGAAAMVLETGEHPAILKDRVASPGGTTIAGLHALERGGLRSSVIDAVQAASKRSSELGYAARADG